MNQPLTLRRLPPSVASVLALAFASALAAATRAAEINKADNADALNAPTSWTGGVAPGTNDLAVYALGGAARTNALGADLAWGGLALRGNAKSWQLSAGGTLTLGAGGADLSLAGAGLTINCAVALGVPQTWAVTNARTLTVNGAVAGGAAAALSKAGAGTLTFTCSSNSWAGGIAVLGGTLSTDGNSHTLGSGALTLYGGATLSLSGAALSNAVVIPAGQSAALNANATLSGPLSGGGSLTHGSSGAFKLALSGDNRAFSGVVTNTSTLSLGVRSALGTGTLVLKDASGVHSTLAAHADLTGSSAVPNAVVLLNDAELGASNCTGDFELSGAVSGPGGLIVDHPDVTVTLSGACVYSGGTGVSNGALVVNSRLQSGLVTAGAGTRLSGTGTLQRAVVRAGARLSVGAESLGSLGTLAFCGNLSLEAGSTNVMKVVGTNVTDVLMGAGTNTLTLGGALLLDFLGASVSEGDRLSLSQLFQNWSEIAQGPGFCVAAFGLPGGLALDAAGVASNGTVAVVAATASPLLLPDEFPLAMTYHGPSPGTNTLDSELQKYASIEILGAVASGVWDKTRAAFPGKLILKQSAWGSDIETPDKGSIFPGHLLLMTGTKLATNATPDDTVLYVENYKRIASSQAAIDADNSNGKPLYVLLYKLDAAGQPDWTQAEHAIVTGLTPDHGLVLARAQFGGAPLALEAGRAVMAKHMMFWSGQWQLNFSLQCPRGGPLNLTAAEWFARVVKGVVDESGADGVEFDVARWQWGSLGSNPMDCDNDLVTDYGYIGGVQSFGLGGQVFTRELRRLLGPGKIIQMDSNGPGMQRGRKYVNGCQMECFPNANDYSTFSQAFLHLRRWTEAAEAPPAFSYAYVKTTTTTFAHLLDTDGSDLDWHFRVGFASGLLAGMPSPFTSISDPGFIPDDDVNTNSVAEGSGGAIFKWDEYVGGDLDNWKWLGRPAGAATQDLDGLNASNLFSQASWVWKTETNFGFAASCEAGGGAYAAAVTAIAAVSNVPPSLIGGASVYPGSSLSKTLTYGVRLEPASGMPAFVTNQEYTLEFEARGNDRWDYAGQSFEQVPRSLAIRTPQGGADLTMLVSSNWTFYRVSFLATTNLPLAFGVSEQVGDAAVRDVRLYRGGAERWSRAFTNGLVLLNMTRQPWFCPVAQAYRRLRGAQSPALNNGARIPLTVTVPPWDALFLVRAEATNVLVRAGETLDVAPAGLLLGAGDALTGEGAVTGGVTALSGALVAPGTNAAPGAALAFRSSLTLSGQTLAFDLADSPAGPGDRIDVAGGLTNRGTTVISLRYAAGWLAAGTYTLMTYGSLAGGGFALAAPYPNAALDAGPTSLTLTVGPGGSVAVPYVWSGTAPAGAWDVGATTNWLFDGRPVVYGDGAGVLFDDSASKFAVTLNDTVSPGSLAFAAAGSYSVSGAGGIAGPVGLQKSGAGTLTLTTTNSYSGGTTLSGGTLVGTTASLPGDVVNNASLVFSQASGGTCSGVISGSGSLAKQGAGTLTLAGANTYAGDTVIGATATIQVSSDANLGTGTNVTINQNAALKTTASFATAKGITFAGGNPALNVGAGTTLTVTGPLGGPSLSPRKDSGTGALTLCGRGAFASNAVFLLQTGRLNLAHPAALSGAALKFNGAVTLDNAGAGANAFSAPAGLTGVQLTSGFTYAGTNRLDLSAAPAAFVQTASSIRTITVTTNVLALGGLLSTGTDAVGTSRLEGGLTKAGLGTLLLAGASSYTGATTVSAGRLVLTLGQTNAGPVDVADGAALGLVRGGPSAALVAAALTFGSAQATALDVDLGFFGLPSQPMVRVTGDGALQANGAVTVGLAGLTAETGSFALLDYAGALGGGFGRFQLGAVPRGLAVALVDNAANSSVDVNVTAATSVVWRGAVDNVWDVGGRANWDLGGPTAYQDGDLLAFGDEGTNRVLELAAVVRPGALRFDGSAGVDYVLASAGGGGLAGPAALAKFGAGALTLATSNAFSGGCRLSAGSLLVDSGAALGSGGLVVSNGTVLSAAGAAARTLANPVEVGGNFALGLAGRAKLTLSGPVSLGASTRKITVGTGAGAALSGAISGAGGLTVDTTASTNLALVLSGSNTFAGPLTLNSTASLSVSSSAGLGAGPSVTLNQNAKLATTASFSTGKAFTLVGASPALNPAAGTTLTLAGPVGGSSLTPQLNGAGRLVLAASNAFALGSAFLAQGGGSSTLALGHAASLSGASLRFNGAQHLDNASGADLVLIGLSALRLTTGFTYDGARSLDLGGAVSGFDVLTGATRTLTVASNTLAIGGISGAGSATFGPTTINWTDGALAKAGAGTLLLKSASSFTRGTTVAAGVLRLGADGALPPSGDLTLAGGTLDAGPYAQSPGSLSVTAPSVLRVEAGTRLTFTAQGAAAWGDDLAVTGALDRAGLRFYPAPPTDEQRQRITYNGRPVYVIEGGYLTASPPRGTVFRVR